MEQGMMLQWVRGRITAVMQPLLVVVFDGEVASMGPRSDNRGYDVHAVLTGNPMSRASMGPRSDNRGYGAAKLETVGPESASMGPRSDNRGYGSLLRQWKGTP